MPLPRAVLGQLDKYLQALPADGLAALLGKVERAQALGEIDSGDGVLILSTARQLALAGKLPMASVYSAKRLFLEPIIPFIRRASQAQKQHARIDAGSPDRIIEWLERDLKPAFFSDLFVAADRFLGQGKLEKAHEMVAAARVVAVRAIRKRLADADSDEQMERRLRAQLGGGTALDDARDCADVFADAEAMAALADGFPAIIEELDEGKQIRCLSALNHYVHGRPQMLAYGVALLMHRLARPEQIIRLSKRMAGSDLASALEAHPFGVAGELIVYDVERLAEAIVERVEATGDYGKLHALLQKYYALAHGLRVETELTPRDAWARRLAVARAGLSDRLGVAIARAPGLLRAVFRSVRAEILETPDPVDVANADSAIHLLEDARALLAELALNDLVSRVRSEVEATLDLFCDQLIERLRTCTPREQDKAIGLVEAAARYVQRMSGAEQARLFQRSAASALSFNHKPQKSAAS
ncbi:MAG TPA: hypothetical protein PK405_06700 [Hyphomicrobiales bacterium]|nr:hypothetical protein [Hyphomicrobiales bacterium]